MKAQRDQYREFLAKKIPKPHANGLKTIPPLPSALKTFQRDIVSWALTQGRCAIFAGTGLGKSLMQLTWADCMQRHANGRVLVLTPLAVAQQTVGEAKKFGIEGVAYARDQSSITSRIVVTNYDRIEQFDLSEFVAVVLDESSIIKSHESKTRALLIELCADIPYRLCCTATPAPNDYVELGNHAEFLGVCSAKEMLATWFVHDGSGKATNMKNHGSKPTADWRLKGHAETDFWRWISTWAVVIRHPRDIGYEEPGYDLPPLNTTQITVPVPYEASVDSGMLFPVEAVTLQEQRQASRASIETRVAAAAEIIRSNPDRPWLVWCQLNDEASAIAAAFADAVEVSGSDSHEYKVKASQWFIGSICKCQLPKRSGSTTGNGLQPIAIKSKNTGELRLANATIEDENYTRQTQLSVSAQSGAPNGRGLLNQRGTSSIDCVLTASPQPSIGGCLKSKVADAQYAARPRHQIELSKDPQQARDDYTLTTAMTPTECVGYSVHRAILESENSATILSSSNERCCTCVQPKMRILVSKPTIFGWGLNFQVCSDMVFLGLNNSFEQLYQAIRRCWRFGQTRPVNVHMIAAETEGAVVANLQAKEEAAAYMGEQMAAHMKDLTTRSLRGATPRLVTEHNQKMRIPTWLK